MISCGDIRVQDVVACRLCGKRGVQLYSGLRDKLFHVSGVWGHLRCRSCGLIWLSPQPISEDRASMYSTYYTHVAEDCLGWLVWLRRRLKLALLSSASGYRAVASGWLSAQVGRILSVIPPLREMRSLGIMCLEGTKKGRLLDVGSGSGNFLAFMRDAGWEVYGVEPDAEAAKLASQCFGVSVVVGSLAKAGFPDGFFDAVTLNHVIEHLDDPVELLRQCHRVLRPGGRCVVVTPNVESLGHRMFGQSWFHLDPPRHLHLFSLGTLRAAAERSGFHTKVIRTSGRGAWGVWAASNSIRSSGSGFPFDWTWWETIRAFFFQIEEEALRLVRKDVGEELLLIATVGSDI